MIASCPPAVAELVGPEPWEPFPGIDVDGWTTETWLAGSRLVRRDDPAVVEADVARTRWLADRLTIPAATGPAPGWSVSEPLPGHGAHRPDRQPVPDEVPAAIGAALAAIHGLAVADCPYRRTRNEVVAELAAAAEAGRLDPDRLPDPYRRYQPSRLVELIVETEPDDDELVVGHGWPVVPNFVLDGGRLGAVTGLDRLGVGPRHLDLAIAHRSIQSLFGPEAVIGFYDGYGRDPDLVRLDHAVLIAVVGDAIAGR